jgi:hypothetical protein
LLAYYHYDGIMNTVNSESKSSHMATVPILATKALQMLVSLVNAKFDADGSRRLRAQTERYWPDLWGWIDDEPGKGEMRALAILQKIQGYLQKFWKSSDPYERAWLVHRVRDYHARHLLQPKTKSQREEFNAASTVDAARHAAFLLNLAIEVALDEPPPRTPFQESLYLLERTEKQARFCRNVLCTMPYFIATKKGQEFCKPTCANSRRRESKRLWWATHPEAREKRKQRRQKGALKHAKRNHPKN